jgi:starvation-inducible DNA-binding protein
MREQLVDGMKIVLADTFALYLKTHQFHWNIEGADFPQYHEFLENLYTEVYGSVDKIAEEIRALGEYAPGSFTRFKELSNIKDNTGAPSAVEMFTELQGDNQMVLSSIMTAYNFANQYNEIGLSNFLQDRYDAHKKHNWMLSSILKRR